MSFTFSKAICHIDIVKKHSLCDVKHHIFSPPTLCSCKMRSKSLRCHKIQKLKLILKKINPLELEIPDVVGKVKILQAIIGIIEI